MNDFPPLASMGGTVECKKCKSEMKLDNGQFRTAAFVYNESVDVELICSCGNSVKRTYKFQEEVSE